MNNADWKQIKLKNICDEITVGHVGPMASEYVDSGIPFLRSQNVKPFSVDISDIKFITPDFHKKLKKSALHPGDVVVVRTGYPGVATVIPKTLNASNCSDLVVIRKSPNIDSFFLTCIFNSHWGQSTVSGNLVGAAQQHFNIGAAKEMTINIPPLPTQQKISAILSAYTDLIENNTRRIKILEEMAQAIYREWFVNFRYPGHEGVRMVESELGLVPEGWEISNLGSVSQNFDRLRKPLSSMQRSSRKGCYPYYGAAKVFDYIDDYIFDGYYLLIAEDGSVITPEKKPVLQLVNGKFWANNHTHILQGKPPFSIEYLYLTLNDFDISGYITGAAQPKINQENLNRIPILSPTKEVLIKFDSIIGDCFKQIFLLEQKNTNLRCTRDLLLPRLISGELDVSELDIEIPAA